MKYKSKILALFIVHILVIAPGCNKDIYLSSSGKARNVILIIGDGMGLSQLYGAITVSNSPLNVEKVKNIGIITTHSFDNYITDSAASGTAMSTGKKTRNGMIGLNPDSLRIANLVEIAHRNDVSAGVVSTSAITHATPASFVAHNINRTHYEEIAEDFLKTQPDVFIGGGQDHFMKRKDKKNLVEDLKSEGYDVALTIEELLAIEGSPKLAGLLTEEHMATIAEGRGDMLAYATLKALETLQQNPRGFFLMVEGSQIDWAAHDHNTKYLLEETIDLDRTLGIILDYAAQRGETLVLMTADHETGGMTLVDGDLRKRTLVAEYSSLGHTGTPVPIYAFGPQSDEFTGIYDNTDLFKKIKDILTLK